MHDSKTDSPIPLAHLIAIAAFALLCLGFHWFSDGGWVPILDSANLVLHEAGHPLIGVLSGRLMVYGGTIFQLAFPLAAAWHFQRSGNCAGAAAAMVWLGENLLNVARYMADARVQELPLVGGGEHDWAEIFSRWGVLQLDTRVAGLTRWLAVLIIGGALLWLYRRWQAQQDGM
ncbi:MAG: hypothetical protein U1F63_07680 [Chitinivorax sp.]